MNKVAPLRDTKICECCFRETVDFRFIEGAIHCEDCVSGKTQADLEEEAGWDEFDRILAASRKQENDA